MPITNRNTAIVLDTLNKTDSETSALLFNVVSEDNAKLVAGGSAVSIGKISTANEIEISTKYDTAITKKQSIYRYFENMTLPFYIEREVQPLRPGDNSASSPFTNKDKGRRKHFSPQHTPARHHVSTQHGLAVTVMPPFSLRQRPTSATSSTQSNTVSGIISGFIRFKNNPNPMSVFCFSAPDTNPVVASSFTKSELSDMGVLVDYLGNKDIDVSLHATGDQ